MKLGHIVEGLTPSMGHTSIIPSIKVGLQDSVLRDAIGSQAASWRLAACRGILTHLFLFVSAIRVGIITASVVHNRRH